MYCVTCGEVMCGDGYTRVIHCPNADETTYEFHEPDANPVHCQLMEDETPMSYVAKMVKDGKTYRVVSHDKRHLLKVAMETGAHVASLVKKQLPKGVLHA